MLTLILAFAIGIVAGLRALTAPTMIGWAARLKLLTLSGTWLAFLGFAWTPWILTVFALGELVNDKLPATPSRTVPPQFGARIVMGSISGAAIGIPVGAGIGGALAGALGAVAGTLGGAQARGSLAKAIGKDLPIALLEDTTAIVCGILIVRLLA